MRVGFYFDASHIAPWDWKRVLQGEMPLSGTDRAILRIAHEVADSTSIDVVLLTTVAGQSTSATPVAQEVVDDFSEGVAASSARSLDVLVFNGIERPEIIEGLKLAEKQGQTCIAWCQNGPWQRMANLYTEMTVVKRVLCVSAPQADAYRDRPVFDKIEVLHNAVDTEWYAPSSSLSSDENTVCYLGALTPSKGFHHLARAWPTVQAAVPEARLVVIGSARLYDRSLKLGPLDVATPEYERECIIPHLGSSREEAEEARNVFFRGLLSPRQIRDALQNASVGIVNPNVQGSVETFCVSAVEMQATETPVIGGARKGLRETVRNGETGVLLNSPDELPSAIYHRLINPESTRRMGRRGRELVERRFDLSRIVERWEQLFTETVHGSPPRSPVFSPRRATPKTFLRESIRYLHTLAGPGNRLPFLDDAIDYFRG
jgi:glycosyltransferase involved in cell wall biosynthesis